LGSTTRSCSGVNKWPTGSILPYSPTPARGSDSKCHSIWVDTCWS
jgi:hypothetical protein